MITNKNNTTLAFSSNAPRFNNKMVDEAETFLGPGYYDVKSNFEQGGKRKQANQSNKIFMGGAQSNAVIAQMSQIGQAALNTRSATSFNQQQQPVRAMHPGAASKMNTQDTPGPGHYSQDNLNGWFKRSYNMNFSEI